MSHVTHTNESSKTTMLHVGSHARMNHATHMNMSRHTYERHVTHRNESRHAHTCGQSGGGGGDYHNIRSGREGIDKRSELAVAHLPT